MDKTYKLLASNTVVYEELKDVEESVFEDVYKAADRTLLKIVKDNERSRSDSDNNNDLIGNVIAFLGGRGRGKTSTMLSFLKKMNYLKSYNWSYFHNLNNKDTKTFLTLQYIDAAMLAENEFIIDVVLAEMWDKFEKELGKESIYSQEIAYRKALEQQIKQQFVNTRHAYMIAQEHETGDSKRDNVIDLPTVGALHELAASINLRQQMIKLVKEFLDFFNSASNISNYPIEDNRNIGQYLVIAIDDIDMSGGKSHYILEQIRRYLSIPNVIVMVTADIDRLHKACEKRYEELYKDDRDRQQVISEYLEKVLPYNMRVYLPELNEKHGKIIIDTEANEELDIQSNNEKDFILEFMAKNCELYFDPTRRKRHFLQNYTMRSMVNYFEQLVRLKGIDYKLWLKTDIKERLVERISNREQKEFIQSLLTKDYEIISDCILSYIREVLGISQNKLGNGGLGQVLYGCNLLENNNEENSEFVNCVIMLYSVILKSVDSELRNKIWRNTILGNWEYNIAGEYDTEFVQNFSEKGKLELYMSVEAISKMKKDRGECFITKFIKKYNCKIEAWAAMLMFVTIVTDTHGDVKFRTEWEEVKEVIVQSDDTNDAQNDAPKILGYKVKIMPQGLAKKTYLSCCYGSSKKVYTMVCKGVESIINAFEEKFQFKIGDTNICDTIDTSLKKELKDLFDEQDNEDNVMIDTSAVEIVYSMGRAMNQVPVIDSNEGRNYYHLLIMNYNAVLLKLRKIEDYYKQTLNVDDMPNLIKTFRESKQVKILLESDFLPQEVQEEFQQNMGKLLLEAKRAGIIGPDISR